jgi:hypothetical protein
LQHHWAEGFMPHSAEAVRWIGQSYLQIFGDFATMWLRWPMVGALAALVGIYGVRRRDRVEAFVLAIPAVMTLLAAMGHRYPFSGRLILFLVPLFVIFIVAGIELLWIRLPRAARIVPAVLLLAVVGPPMQRAAWHLVRPPGREEIRPLLAYLRSQMTAYDTVYVYHTADAPYLYYSRRMGLPGFIHGARPTEDAEAFEKDLRKLRGHWRVWIVVSHVWGEPPDTEEDQLLRVLDGAGTRKDQRRAAGASLYLYDLGFSAASAPSDATPSSRVVR